MTQHDLLSWIPPNPIPIGGATFNESRDGKRLSRQAQIVFDAIKDGEWFLPDQLEALTGFNWASISARLRDFRKPEFRLNATVEREFVADGVFRYRLVMNG